MNMRGHRLLGIVVSLVMVLSCPAGLSDFEDSAKKKWKSPETRNSSNDSHHHHDNDSIVMEIFFEIIAQGIDNSMERMENISAGEDMLLPRSFCEPLLPIVRIDTTYLRENSDIEAYDVRLEAGYGPLAVSLRDTYWVEENPSEYLNVFQWHVLCRLTLSEQLTISPGIGAISLSGDEVNTGNSFTMPIQLHNNDNFGIEYRPTWSSINNNALTEHDIKIVLSEGPLSVVFGHRWFYTETEMLQGPYVGFALHF